MLARKLSILFMLLHRNRNHLCWKPKRRSLADSVLAYYMQDCGSNHGSGNLNKMKYDGDFLAVVFFTTALRVSRK